MRTRWLALALWLLAPAPAAAEWQVRPFIGFTFGGATTFVDPEKAIETQNAVIGVSGGWLGEIFGLEADFGRAPGFFQTDEPPDSAAAEPDLLTSAVTTLTGNVVIALPARMAGYGLRPYFSGGAGLMHVDTVGQLQISRCTPHAAYAESGRRRHRVSDQPRRVELGHPTAEHPSRRRGDAWQQSWTRAAFILACDDGGRVEVLGDDEI